MRSSIPIVLLACAAALTAVTASAATKRSSAANVVAYPSSTTVRGSGNLPAGGARSLTLNTAIGEEEDAIVVARGAQSLQVSFPTHIGPLPVKLFFAHYVAFGGTKVPDALLPWDGSTRATEEANQPVWLQVTVPYGTSPGTYDAAVEVTLDGGAPTPIELRVHVFQFALPPPGQVAGALLTSFNVAGETYTNTVGKLNGFKQSEQYHRVNPTLYRFLASYRISPQRWGYGDPSSPSGYTTASSWFRNRAANMVEEAGPGDFASMAIPLSNNRTSTRNYIAGISPLQPETWCDYLKAVHSFWLGHGWSSSIPDLYGLDETGDVGFKVVAKQATTLHSCFPGGAELITGNPSAGNRFLWDGGSDDVDIWTVLGARFYGKFTTPRQAREGVSRERDRYTAIQQVRDRGHLIWTYNYAGTQTPGFQATEPLSDSAMFFLWAALEGIQGVLYGEDMTAYQGNPFDAVTHGGEFVLLYPGLGTPVPSARLEQIRDGIEDWEILHAVRGRQGAAAVRRLLGGEGLFSTTAAKVELGCTTGCDLKTETPFAWPIYSHDASTPRRLEQAKLAALKSLG
jgi:hypothetical protein